MIIQASLNSGSFYSSYKGTFSIVLLALVDATIDFLQLKPEVFATTAMEASLPIPIPFHVPPASPLPSVPDWHQCYMWLWLMRRSLWSHLPHKQTEHSYTQPYQTQTDVHTHTHTRPQTHILSNQSTLQTWPNWGLSHGMYMELFPGKRKIINRLNDYRGDFVFLQETRVSMCAHTYFSTVPSQVHSLLQLRTKREPL